MRVVQRVCAGLSGLVVVVALVGCGAGDSGNAGVSSNSDPLTVPYSATDLGAGSVKYSVTLPSGQHFVEVFARKNGVQNTAHEITPSGVANNDGTTTYSFVKSGYVAGDNVEYRFYSYIGPRVFTPGPGQTTWLGFVYGGATTFQTSTATYLLGAQLDSSGRTFSYQVETTTGSTSITPYSTGWILSKASPGDDSVAVQLEAAELVGTFVKRAGATIYDPASAYDSYAITATLSPSWLDIAVEPDSAVYPGTMADPKYAEDGHFVTIPTLIGPQTLLTDATLTFAYLIKQKTWSDAAPVTVKELVP
jgi:hypothetical protein